MGAPGEKAADERFRFLCFGPDSRTRAWLSQEKGRRRVVHPWRTRGLYHGAQPKQAVLSGPARAAAQLCHRAAGASFVAITEVAKMINSIAEVENL